MALNVTFVADIVDENENLIDCSYKGFAYPQNIWSGEQTTEFNQANINLGSGDWLTQTGAVSIGDIVVLKFYTSNYERFSCIKVVLDGREVYNLGVIQLIPSQPPTCDFTINDVRTINNEIIATSNATDLYQWNYLGLTHYHKDFWYGTDIFSNVVGIASVEYSWFGMYQNLDRYTYTSIGDYTIWHKPTNKSRLFVECKIDVRIKYNSPICGFTQTPIYPLLNEDVTIASNLQDPDNRITQIVHSFDGSTLDTNLDFNYSYIKQLPVFKNYLASQAISWNDGFENLIHTCNKNVSMQPQPPITELICNKLSNTQMELIHNSQDVDGTIEKLKWQIYLKSPFDDTFFLVYEEIDLTLANQIFEVNQSGLYRIVLTVTDSQNLTASAEYECEMECKSGGEKILPQVSKLIKITTKTNEITITPAKRVFIAHKKLDFYIEIKNKQIPIYIEE